jgi:hypothetical protein
VAGGVAAVAAEAEATGAGVAAIGSGALIETIFGRLGRTVHHYGG